VDITVRHVYCGNKNCIGVEATSLKIPPRLIVIEDVWDVPSSVIEDAFIGLISHETIEWLLVALFPKELLLLHDLIGSRQIIKDYMGNADGIVIKNKFVMPEAWKSMDKKDFTGGLECPRKLRKVMV